MKSNPFTIYIDRLKNDDTEQIHESVSPDLIELEDKDLEFIGNVLVSGHAYLAKNHIIFDLKIKATVQLPCSICNETTKTPIHIDPFSHTVEICEMKSSLYHYTDEIRNAILLKVPQFVECHQGHCPHRKEIDPYLKKTSQDEYTPFSQLNSPID